MSASYVALAAELPELEAIYRILESESRTARQAAFLAFVNEQFDAEYEEDLTIEDLVATGDEDRGNTPDMARRLAALIPGAHCEILPGQRHMGLAEDPEAFNRPLLNFLEEVLGSES